MSSPGIVLNDVKRKDMLMLDVACLKEYPNTRRFPISDEAFTRLKDSIREHGQLEPILVNEEAGVYWAYTGHNRIRAIRELVEDEGVAQGDPGRRRILAVKRKADGYTQFKLSIVENAHRANTSAIDDAHNIQRLEDVYAQSREEIAKLYGKSQAWVSQRISLLNLSEDEQLMAHNQEIGASTAYQLSKMDPEQRAEVLEMAKDPETGKVDRAAASKAATSDKEPRRTVKEMALNFEEESKSDLNSEGCREIFTALKEYAKQECEMPYLVEVMKRWTK